MVDKPLVTIRIPAFNHEDFIEKAIMSAINQTYPNIEIIVIDDGSRDKTPEIAQRLADKYGFTFIRQENVGVSETMNRLFALSNGEYILGCASDDYLDEKAVEHAVEVALKRNADIVCGRVKIVNNVGEITGELNFKANNKITKDGILMKKILLPKQGFLYKKRLLQNIHPIPETIKVEDAYTFLKLPNTTKFACSRKVFKYYRSHGMNTISNKYKMYENKKELINNYTNKQTDKYYILNAKIGWFKDLALDYPKLSLKYLYASTYFLIISGFSFGLIKTYVSAILRLVKIDFSKFGN